MIRWTVGIACAFATCVWVIRKNNLKKNLNRFVNPSGEFQVITAEPVKDARTVLVTGGNGFLGKYVSSYLADKQINVVVFDLFVPDDSNRRKNVSYIRGNLLNVEHLERALTCFPSVDTVIHTASLIPFLGVPDEAIWTVNVDGTKNLLNACAAHGVRHFIYTSSATAALELSNRVSRKLKEDCPAPVRHVDTYATTKFAAERLVLDANKSTAIVTCVLRPCAIFGRGDKVLADKLIFGQDNCYLGDGSARLDWVPVESVARAHVLAEEALFSDEKRRQQMQGATYFIGNNEERQYGWFLGAPMDGNAGGPLSHWGYQRPQRLPIALVMALAYFNLAMYNLIGAPVLPASLAPSLVDFTQRTFTFCSDRAARDFGYAPTESVADAIKRLVAEEARRRAQAEAGKVGAVGQGGRQ